MIINGNDYDWLLIEAKVRLRQKIDEMHGLDLHSAEVDHNSGIDSYDSFPDCLIVSDGLPCGTTVYVKGIKMDNITEVEIMPINAGNEPISARITVFMPKLHIRANVDNSSYKR